MKTLEGYLKDATTINLGIISTQKQMGEGIRKHLEESTSTQGRLAALFEKAPKIFEQKDPKAFLNKKIQQLSDQISKGEKPADREKAEQLKKTLDAIKKLDKELVDVEKSIGSQKVATAEYQNLLDIENSFKIEYEK